MLDLIKALNKKSKLNRDEVFTTYNLWNNSLKYNEKRDIKK
jgi:hypothetical protein